MTNGQPVFLDSKSLQQKLIDEGRGGYCFEQNLLLRAVLITLGFQVTELAARVLWNLPEGTISPRTHMLLQIDLEGEQYITDVGFGQPTPTAPLSLTPDIEQTTPHEPFRLLLIDRAYILQASIAQKWKSLYCFELVKQQLIDYEVSNWYVSTHPNSQFVTSLMVARTDTDCRYALRNNQLTTHYLEDRSERRVLTTTEELRDALESLFLLQLPAIADLDDILKRLVK